MPKASSLITDRERAICLRFREVRREQRWPQREFANSLGLTRNKVAAIEAECTPVQYWVGRQLCAQFGICQRWLADGDLPKAGCISIAPEIEAEIAPRQLFSEAYDRRLRAQVIRAIKEASQETLALELYQAAGGSVEKSAADRARDIIQLWFLSLPIERHDALFRFLSFAAAQFRLASPAPPISVDQAFGIESGKECKEALDTVPCVPYNAGVKVRIRSLRELVHRLKQITSAPGAKASLARKLGVSRQAVSQWLSGKSNPTAEATLQLLNWVEEPEAQQTKKPGSESPQPGQKTQVRKSKTYEKANSNRKKR
jgi:transcriptional regulator with XRE-family HTH domain